MEAHLLQAVRLEEQCLVVFSKKMETQLDPSIVALTKAIGHQESGGDYNKIGDNGHSLGAYQWNNPTPLAKGQIPKNFAGYATDVGADGNDFSPTNQDRVAYKTVEKWGKEGLTPAQIASRWNSGNPNAYKTAKPGYNKEQGVSYDIGAYVNNVSKYYDQYIGNKNPQNLTKDKMVNSTDIQTPQEDNNLKADTGNGIVGKTVGVLGDISGTKKLGEGLGYAINNALGGQEGLIKANNQGIDIEGQLIQQIKKDKAKGKDTSKLEKALKELIPSIQDNANKVSDVGTGGISNTDVGLSALQTGATVLTAPSLIKSGIGLFKGGTAPAVEEGIKRVGLNMTKYEALGNADKVEALTEALKRATPVNAKVIQQTIDKLLPAAIKEAGGKVAFAQLYPKSAKALGIVGGLIKKGLGTAATLAVGAEGANLYNKYIK